MTTQTTRKPAPKYNPNDFTYQLSEVIRLKLEETETFHPTVPDYPVMIIAHQVEEDSGELGYRVKSLNTKKETDYTDSELAKKVSRRAFRVLKAVTFDEEQSA